MNIIFLKPKLIQTAAHYKLNFNQTRFTFMVSLEQ